MPEVNFNETTSVRDKVYFKGKAVVSDAEAKAIEQATKEAEEVTEQKAQTAETAKPSPKGKK